MALIYKICPLPRTEGLSALPNEVGVVQKRPHMLHCLMMWEYKVEGRLGSSVGQASDS